MLSEICKIAGLAKAYRHTIKCRRKGVCPDCLLFPVIWITNRCNLKCRMCDQWKTPAGSIEQELSREEWFRVVDSAADLKASLLCITGGEALLRDDVFDIIARARDKNISVHLCSNGTLLDRAHIAELVKSRLCSISVSLDSHVPDVHNFLRGRDCFGKVVEGIKRLRKDAPGIRVGINSVISSRNFAQLDQLVDFVTALGVDQVKFDPIHSNLMHRNKPKDSYGDLFFSKQQLEQLPERITQLKAKLAQSGLGSSSPKFFDGITDVYVRGKKWNLPCYVGFISCAIDPFGKVSPCDEFDGVGDLRTQSLEQVWKSPEMDQLRQKVFACDSGCWDTTHAEINLRCWNGFKPSMIGQLIKDLYFYYF